MTNDKRRFDLCDYFLWFIFYSLIGWIYESAFCSIEAGEFVNRGFLNGPYIPIYGTSAIIVIFLFANMKSRILLFFCSMAVTSIMEYATSWALESIFHKRWWDYSDYFFNLNGRICLLAAVAFGVMCVLLVKHIHPRIASVTYKISRKARTTVAFVLLLVVLVDCGFSFSNEIQEVGRLLGEGVIANFLGRLW